MQTASPESYYQGANHRILARVPVDAKRILDIGCGAGNLGQLLKEQGSAREVWGVEIVLEAGREAKSKLDSVLVGDIEAMDPLPLPQQYFDCVICGDVLEHLKAPEILLSRLRPHLSPGAMLVVNVPNVAHWSIVLPLLRGEFNYEDCGLLDRTHLRFFTPGSLHQMLWEAGYRVIEGDSLRIQDKGELGAVLDAAVTLGVPRQIAEHALGTYQQLYVCKPVPNPREDAVKLGELLGPHQGKLGQATKRCSVIVVTYNCAGCIERLLESLGPTLSDSDEVIFIDNASSDGTPYLLDSLQGESNKMLQTRAKVKVILNEANLGFSAGCNAGILACNGEYIVLLNPDTQVFPHWIERLMARLQDPAVGATGPLSDNVCGDQFVAPHLPPATYVSAEHLAAALATRSGSTVYTKLLVGFCLMLRRKLLDEFGLLEERCFLGADDLEMSWRLRCLGYELAVAGDVFISHQTGQSFATLAPGEKEAHVFKSDRALIAKLRGYYGEGPLPTSFELWGNSIFDEALARRPN